MTYHLPAGKAADGVLAVDVTPEKAGWGCSSLRVLDLPPGGTHTFDSADSEWIVLPLSGACTVATADDFGRETFELHGRADVFSGVSDFAYVPRDARTTVTTAGSPSPAPAAPAACPPATDRPRRCRWSCGAAGTARGR
jgi:5-deoxy-glucuronate isomerase